MKTVNRARIAIAISIALGLTAISSSATAQIIDIDKRIECETLAWELCYYPGAPAGVWQFRCWHDTYDSCLEGGPYLTVNKPAKGDRRSESQLASRTAAAMRFG